MATLDVFKGDAFSSASLTESLNKLPFKPGRIGQMGLFKPKGIRTTTAWMEEKGGVLSLIENRRRGGPANLYNHGKRTARSVRMPHLPLEDEVLAGDIQDIRAFGSETELEQVATVVAEHLSEMRDDHETTLEHMRVKALHGVVLDADGTTELVSFFDMFEVAEITVDFDFGTAEIRNVIQDLIRQTEDELGGLAFDHVHVICGNDWWDAFMADPNVKAAFDRWEMGAQLRDDFRSGFNFAGAIFENYRGSVGGTPFVATGVARSFPVGVDKIYKTLNAPADFIETVNTPGLPFYAKQERMDFDRGIRLHTQSNPLPVCFLPRVLISITKS